MGMVLRQKRKEAGLTLVELAERLDVSHTAISLWERGKQQIPEGRYRQIADALDFEVAELTGVRRYVQTDAELLEWFRSMASDPDVPELAKTILLHIGELARPALNVDELKVISFHGDVDRLTGRVKSFDPSVMIDSWDAALDSVYLSAHPESTELLHLRLPQNLSRNS